MATGTEEEWETERNVRKSKMEKLWSEFTKQAGFRETFLICGRAIRLFKEALFSFENGAFLGCAVMCRASTEALVYVSAAIDFVKLRRDKNFIVYQSGIDYTYTEETYSILLKKAESNNLIETSDEEKINYIRSEGNFGAHYGQKFDERTLKYSIYHQPPNLDITSESAFEILERTTKILGTVMNRMLEVVMNLPLK